MAAAEQTMVIRVELRWWVRAYLCSCALFALTFGVVPDVGCVAAFILKWGIRFEVAR